MSLLSRTKEIFGTQNQNIDDVLNINTAAITELEEYNYDYTELPEEKATSLRNATCEIRRRSLKTALEAAAIGKKLLEVKEYLPHGEYLKWIEKELTQPGYFTRWAARNYVNAYLFLEKYRDLKQLVKLSPNTIYIAARCDEDTQREILEAAKYYNLNKSEVARIISNSKVDEDEYEEILQEMQQLEEAESISELSLPIKLVDITEETVEELEQEQVKEVFENVEITVEQLKEKKEDDSISCSTRLVLYHTNLHTNTPVNVSALSSICKALTKGAGILIARADTLSTYLLGLTAAGAYIHCIGSIRRDIRTIISNDDLSYNSLVLFCILFSPKPSYIHNINDFVNNPKIGILHYVYELTKEEEEIVMVFEDNQGESCISEAQMGILRDRNKIKIKVV